ncbi:hypothetical protein P5705_09985 [Pseudomonas entomophila]|uniref:hypothetical protein n=1 Tax=Pseudomonas entomophila TaxID=312306 RepID=UPI002405E7E2|nr:hypothetical protein [Pseudomonas entomophila]MDF9617971.1 hypothetical protein [Pseudomonas entomophila]
MSEHYEIILQQVEKSDLHALLKCIETRSQTFSGLAISEEFGGMDSAGINKNLIDAIVAHEGDVCMTEHLHEFNASGTIRLPLVFLRVIKYKGEVDVELSFNDAPSLDIDRVMLAMQGYADELSKKFHIKEFYGGLEPAADIDTRYFTGNTLDPLD